MKFVLEPILPTQSNNIKCPFTNLLTCRFASSLFEYLTCFPRMFHKFTSRVYGRKVKSQVLASSDGSEFKFFHGHLLAV